MWNSTVIIVVLSEIALCVFVYVQCVLVHACVTEAFYDQEYFPHSSTVEMRSKHLTDFLLYISNDNDFTHPSC